MGSMRARKSRAPQADAGRARKGTPKPQDWSMKLPAAAEAVRGLHCRNIARKSSP